MKALRSVLASLLALLFCSALAEAQNGFNAYFGLGTAHDSSANQLIDLVGTGTPLPTPSMGGVFGTLGGGLMLNSNFGVGGEALFRFAQGDYAGLGYRPVFYDFNGIWTPTFSTKKIMPELQGGFGGVSLRFYGGGAQSCDYYTGICSDFAGSSNHFQLHVGIGLRFYVKEHIYVRPQLDYHWVRGLNEFRSDSVPAYGIAIGFSS